MIKRLLLLLLPLFVFATAVSKATTVERLTVDELVKKANRIVVGRVNASRTYWSPNGKLILTSYTLVVEESMKGSPSRTVDITTIGGTIGTLSLHVSGMPSFENGEDAVVFVEDGGAFSTVVGLGQGKFKVSNGEVSNAVSDLSFPDGQPGKPVKMPLESFKRQIKQLVGR